MAAHFFYFSNKTEKLCQPLAKLLTEPTSSPLRKEVILVHNYEMRNYLTRTLAQINGICAAIDFCYPSHFLRNLLLQKPEGPFPLDPNRMIWLIWQVLSDRKNKFIPGDIAQKVEEKDSRALYHICLMLANAFDRYLVHHPDQIRAWQANSYLNPKDEQEKWQASLWSYLIKKSPDLNIDRQLDNFFSSIKRGTQPLPPRLFIFGTYYLPSLFQEILLKLSQFIDIHWFFLQPGSHYNATPKDPFLKHYNQGSLVFLKALAEKQKKRMPNAKNKYYDCFVKPKASTLLGLLQKKYYDDEDTMELTNQQQKRYINDDSLSIHACHSPLREVEVLRDWLLSQFHNEAKLRPEDILIMSPDPNLYAPLIETTFVHAVMEGSSILPFNLSTSDQTEKIMYNEIFLELISMGTSRFKVDKVLHILSNPWIAQKAKFSQDDLKCIERWLKEANIRWGFDAKHRGLWNLPEEASHSFAQGLDRLFLSHAMGTKTTVIVNGLSPVTDLESDSTLCLGRLCEFIEQLKTYSKKLRGNYHLKEWRNLLKKLEMEFLGKNKFHDILTRLEQIQNETKFKHKVDIVPIKAYLKPLLNPSGTVQNSQNKGIRFSGIMPVGGAPYSMICLIGMNEGSFPKKEAFAEFDLLQKAKLTDRLSKAEEDRLFFMDILLATESKLYISYLGSSSHRPKEKYRPSIVVQELGTCLESFIPNAKPTSQQVSAMRQITHEHSLQGFDPSYFSPQAKFVSYSTQNFQIAKALKQKSNPHPPFWDNFKGSPKTLDEVDFKSFLGFFKNPAKSCLKKNLDFVPQSAGTINQKYEADPEDIMEIENLQVHQIYEKHIKNAFFSEEDKRGLLSLESKGQGILPHGTYGQCKHELLLSEIRYFLSRVEKHAGGKLIPINQEFSIPLAENLSLSGIFKHYFNTKGIPISLYYWKCKASNMLQAWIHHLVWQILQTKKSSSKSICSYLITKDKTQTYQLMHDSPQQIALDYLNKLMAVYQHGREIPLPFFCESGFHFVKKMEKESLSKAMAAAKGKWQRGFYSSGEENDPYTKLCFRGKEPMQMGTKTNTEFQKLSLEIYQPLLANCQEIKD